MKKEYVITKRQTESRDDLLEYITYKPFGSAIPAFFPAYADFLAFIHGDKECDDEWELLKKEHLSELQKQGFNTDIAMSDWDSIIGCVQYRSFLDKDTLVIEIPNVFSIITERYRTNDDKGFYPTHGLSIEHAIKESIKQAANFKNIRILHFEEERIESWVQSYDFHSAAHFTVPKGISVSIEKKLFGDWDKDILQPVPTQPHEAILDRLFFTIENLHYKECFEYYRFMAPLKMAHWSEDNDCLTIVHIDGELMPVPKFKVLLITNKSKKELFTVGLESTNEDIKSSIISTLNKLDIESSQV